MSENQSVEAVESEALTEESIAAINEAWDDDSDFGGWGEQSETADEQDAEPEKEDSEDESDGGESAEPEKEPEPEPEKKEEAGHQRFKLKVKGEEKEVDLDEMTTLAQKGGDYDGLKEDRDNLRTENGKLKDYETFLKELAENGGVSIEEVMENTRVEMLLRKAETDGKALTEDEARAQVKAAHKKKEETKQQKPAEKTAEEKAQEAISAFVQRYPNVKSADIPQQVWDDANRTGNLIGAYQDYLLTKMGEEIAQLKQNKKNSERSTGSRKTAGAASAKSKIDEAWEAGLKESW